MKNKVTTILDLLERTAILYPESCAIDGPMRSWNYAEMDITGNKIAHYIKNLTSHENVIICMNRSDWMIMTILGILKSGNTYIPIDPLTPQPRIEKVIETTSPKLVITDEYNMEKFKNISNVISIEEIKIALSKLPASPVKIRIDKDDTAYIIFTSGTTGLPKGIPILHKSLLNKILYFNPKLSFNPSHNFILLASIAFDASIGQIFLPLTHGSTLHIMNYEDQKDPNFFWDYVTRKKINILYTIPSLINALLETPLNLRNISIDYILLGAELFPPSLLSKIKAKLSVNKIVNMYGPTEITVNGIMHVMTGVNEPDYVTIPIGTALPGYEIFILDEKGNSVKDGEPGEIAIAGIGLSPGYYKDPTLTNEKFIMKSFSGVKKRIYLTGDYGCRNMGKYFEFLGRKDSQIKINGFRIELLEIEKVIKDNAGVKHCMVNLNPSNKDQIIAFVQFTAIEKDIDPVEVLSAYLKTNLPYYMVPNKIIQVSDFPILISGKPDKLKLLSHLEAKVEILQQRRTITPVEDTIIEAWKEIFNIQRVTTDDNFINLGGGSIQSISLVNKLLHKGIQIQPSDVYVNQTVSELAKVAKLVTVDTTEISDQENHIPKPVFSSKPELYDENKISKHRLRIEAMGAYIPKNFISTKEIMEGCVNEIGFPIERFTGIKTRPVAEPDESSFEIGRKAITSCLSKSTLKADDIELLICCNTVRSLGTKFGLFDPSFSLLYKKEFGFKKALSFDINNACAGMFTGVEIADIMMKSGTITNALVVSGEHCTPVTKSAQLELVNDKFDNRLACLTVGDAGVAITLDQSTNDNGFEFMEILTMGDLSNLCIGKIDRTGHGGPIMYNDSIRAAAVGITPGIMHVFQSMSARKWDPKIVDHFIMHQTSLTTIKNSMREINLHAGEQVVSDSNVVINLENRGNTAASCQFLALYDNIMNGRIKSESKIVFPINGSGRVIGTALFTMDDLPDKLTSANKPKTLAKKKMKNEEVSLRFGVKIESMSVHYPRELSECQTKVMNRKAALKCLAESDIEKNDIGLIIFSGVLRDDFITEPALAATLAGELKINSSGYSPEGQSTFCFDVLNGNMGTFNAIQIASEYIRSGKVKSALIIASEIDYNKSNQHPGISPVEMSSAILLSMSKEINSGLGKFVNDSSCTHPIEKKVYADTLNSETFLHRETLYITPENQVIDTIIKSVEATLSANKLEVGNIDNILLPGISGKLIIEIAERLDVDVNLFFTTEKNDEDLGSSALVYYLNQYISHMSGYKQKTIIIIESGDGLATGGVSYVF